MAETPQVVGNTPSSRVVSAGVGEGCREGHGEQVSAPSVDSYSTKKPSKVKQGP